MIRSLRGDLESFGEDVRKSTQSATRSTISDVERAFDRLVERVGKVVSDVGDIADHISKIEKSEIDDWRASVNRFGSSLSSASSTIHTTLEDVETFRAEAKRYEVGRIRTLFRAVRDLFSDSERPLI